MGANLKVDKFPNLTLKSTICPSSIYNRPVWAVNHFFLVLRQLHLKCCWSHIIIFKLNHTWPMILIQQFFFPSALAWINGMTVAITLHPFFTHGCLFVCLRTTTTRLWARSSSSPLFGCCPKVRNTCIHFTLTPLVVLFPVHLNATTFTTSTITQV